jgi:DNA invertase Pin-like site-specific DNA recombinase
MISQPIKKYVGYFRVSTQKQKVSGLGLDAQQKAVQEYLHHYGGELIAEFTETESGKKSDRPEFQKAADYAELANCTLLVAKLDRLSRDLHFVTSLQKRGIQFKLADMPEIDNLTIHILAAMAEHEARMVSVRTKQALAIAKEKGVVLGNPNFKTGLQINRDNSAAIAFNGAKISAWKKKILKVIDHIEVTEGITSCTGIAKALNDRGLTSYRNIRFSVPIVSRLRIQAKS